MFLWFDYFLKQILYIFIATDIICVSMVKILHNILKTVHKYEPVEEGNMSTTRADRVDKLANLLASSRIEAGKSQTWMAAELGVSRHSIINWESGISSPDFFTFSEWFRALRINPTKYLLQFFNIEEIDGIKPTDDDERISAALNAAIASLTSDQKRAVFYLLFGTYKGDPGALLQLFVAYAHLPMANRFFIANTIYETYKMCEATDQLKDMDKILPDMKLLGIAIEKGKEAASKNLDTYTL